MEQYGQFHPLFRLFGTRLHGISAYLGHFSRAERVPCKRNCLYRKSQADSQADSQAFFQAFFSPFGSDPWGSESRPLYFRIIASASASRLMTRIRLGSVPRIYIAGRRGRGCMENGADCIFPSTTLRPAWKKRIIFPFPK